MHALAMAGVGLLVIVVGLLLGLTGDNAGGVVVLVGCIVLIAAAERGWRDHFYARRTSSAPDMVPTIERYTP